VRRETPTVRSRTLSDGEREEMRALRILTPTDVSRPASRAFVRSARGIRKRAMRAHAVLNEAYEYSRPSSFSRGIRFDLGDKTLLMISGTASIDESGQTRHAGDFRAQLWRTYGNISSLLASEGSSWQDVVRTTCYLRDIERDYRDFNEIRTTFFGWLSLDPLPASTGIQAVLCRDDLLVEIEAIAVIARGRGKRGSKSKTR
jgi:2-iminobutanoate/2-iminopropanoate deaminase